MDIQVSSNAERLVFEMLGRDGAAVARAMTSFRARGELELPVAAMAPVQELFTGASFDDDATRAEIARTYETTGVLVDPHTAVGLAAARRCRRDASIPMVALATAHPAKFPDAVEQATGVRPALPDHLVDLFDRREEATELPDDVDAVRSFLTVTLAP
jgi:threonine synthase